MISIMHLAVTYFPLAHHVIFSDPSVFINNRRDGLDSCHLEMEEECKGNLVASS